MTLALTANWLEAFRRSNVEPRHLIDIETNTAATFRAVDNDAPLIDVDDVGIASVNPLTAEIDPATRRMQMSTLAITCYDAWIRPILVNNRLRGQKITVQLGEKSLAEGDYAVYFQGVIESVVPEPNGTHVTLYCIDAITMLRTQKIVGYWNNVHPLQAIEDILIKAGVPAALYDATTMDPSDPDYSDIGHFVVSRSGGSFGPWDDSTVRTPTEPFELISQLLQMCDSSLVVDEDGIMRVKRFDPTAAAAADWDDDTIMDLEQDALDENIVNRVTCGFLGFPREYEENYSRIFPNPSDPTQMVQTATTVTKIAQGLQLDDATSQSDFAHPDGTERILEAKINLPWCNQYFMTLQAINDTITSWTGHMSLYNICGTRGLPGVQPAEAVVSGARPMWIAKDNEIMRITAVALATSGSVSEDYFFEQIDPETNLPVQVSSGAHGITLTIDRGQLGTTAEEHTIKSDIRDHAIDVTIPKFVAENIIKRFKQGAFVATVTTSLAEFDKQLLDLVTLDSRNFVGFGFDGIVSGSGKWEIVGKEVDVYANPPLIRWRLVFIPDDTIAPTARSWRAYHQRDPNLTASQENQGTHSSQGYILNGLGITATGGFGVEIAPGSVGSANNTLQCEGTAASTIGASQDVYVYMNLQMGGTVLLSVDNNDPAPTRPPGSVFIGKVISDGVGVTSVIQDRDPITGNVPIKPFNGNRVQINSVGTNSLDTRTQLAPGQNVVPNSDFGSFNEEADIFFGT